MKRRNKDNMEQMKDLVSYYLTFSNNDPHKAYDEYIKEHLLSGKQLPYFIKGLEDFIKVAKQKEVEKQIKEEKEMQQIRNEDGKELLIIRYTEDQEGLNKALKEYKGTPVYKKLVEFWMSLQEAKPQISNSLYGDLRGILY